MKIICKKGFYKFFPQNIGEVARFQKKYGVVLYECDDYFTFKVLSELPNYSFIGHRYSGLTVGLVNYAGKIEEVMEKNNYIYAQNLQTLILKNTFVKRMNYNINNYIFMSELPQAYCYDTNGIISGFEGFVDVDYMKFKIERFFYENI
jgi:hypothetical protein